MAGKPRVTLPPRRAAVVTPIQRPPEQPLLPHQKMTLTKADLGKVNSWSEPTIAWLVTQGCPHLRIGPQGGRLGFIWDDVLAFLRARQITIQPGTEDTGDGKEAHDAQDCDHSGLTDRGIPDDGEGPEVANLPEPTHIGDLIHEVVRSRLGESGVAELDRRLHRGEE